MFKNRSKLFYIGLALTACVLCASLALTVTAIVRTFAPVGSYEKDTSTVFTRVTTPEDEDYSEEEDTICAVEYEAEDGSSFIIRYTYKEWEALGDARVFSGVVYREVGGERVVGFVSEADDAAIAAAVRDLYADEQNPLYSAAFTLFIFALSLSVVVFFGKHFTTYEIVWFLSIMTLAAAFALIMPEESCNGVSGVLIMVLYLLDTFLNILCELLISKQSKWNFIVSVFVEITEILICIVLAYRFATMMSTLLFWLPCDIISFINWHKKPDSENDELTRVRTLKGWQEVAILAGIVVWTVGIGYLLTCLDFGTDLFDGNRTLEVLVCYLDACASAVGITNGLAILFRFREQWISWFICAILEAIINILAGQWVLLPLKLGYLTNSTYGFIRWTKYIKAHPEEQQRKSFF